MSTRPGPRYAADACNEFARHMGKRIVKTRHEWCDNLDTHFTGYLALGPATDHPESVALSSVHSVHDWYVNGIQGPFPNAPTPDALDRGHPIDGDDSRRRQVYGAPDRIHIIYMSDHPYWEPEDCKTFTPEPPDEPAQSTLFDL